jgi:hypothetical protein
MIKGQDVRLTSCGIDGRFFFISSFSGRYA